MDLSHEQSLSLKGTAAQYGLQMILVFGSAVSGKQHLHSDLDIAVLRRNKEFSYREYSDLLHDLQKIFSGQSVDLSLINHADPLFLKKITESCQLLFGNTKDLQALKVYAFKRFQDHKRFFEMERSFVDRFVKESSPRS